MIAWANRLYADDVRTGRVTVKLAAADAIPFDDGYFEHVLTVKRIYFWGDIKAGLTEARRVMSSGAYLSVGIMPKQLQEQVHFADRGHKVFCEEELAAALEEAAFRGVVCAPQAEGRGSALVAHTP